MTKIIFGNDIAKLFNPRSTSYDETGLGKLVAEGLWISGSRINYAPHDDLPRNALINVYESEEGLVAVIRSIYKGMDLYRQPLNPEETEQLHENIKREVDKCYNAPYPFGLKRIEVSASWLQEIKAHQSKQKEARRK